MTSPKQPVDHQHAHSAQEGCHCCPDSRWHRDLDLSRRDFLVTAAVGGAMLGALSWAGVTAAAEGQLPMPGKRAPLQVLPVLVWSHPKRAAMTSWRGWGGIDSPETAAAEVARITKELAQIAAASDFPVQFAEVVAVEDVKKIAGTPALQAADVVVVYGAGGGVEGCQDFGKEVILFQRHRSGPVYLQYEVISPRFLRRHTDTLALKQITFEDVVTDSLDELTWRLRALCGLKNTRGSKILCIGGADAWAQPPGVVPALVKKVWDFELPIVSYEELGRLIEEARADAQAMALAKRRAEAYLSTPGTTLGTTRESVDNCFLLDHVFRNLMAQADCRAITVLGCMGPIMSKAQTSACLTLSTLNDDGYLAFCESDFVVIPSGMLLANITGKPVFLNDPTYPHAGLITLAHCTGPRKMDGQTVQPAQIVTHFESDYGAAPKVEWPKGQVVTNLAPDFKSERWMGLLGKVVDSPNLAICRDQIDVAYEVPDHLVAERMPGFHWMTSYGDYLKEVGYALRRVGIAWDNLNAG